MAFARLLVACSALAFVAPAHAQVRARSTQIALTPQAPTPEENPVVASDGRGRFAALWTGRDADIPSRVLRLRRVRRDGKALEVKTVAVPLPPPAIIREFTLAFSASGTIAAAWIECENALKPEESVDQLWVKMWDRQLRVTREAAVVNLTEAGVMGDVAIAYLPDGTLMVAWGAIPSDTTLPIRSVVRLFDPKGRAVTPELRIGSDGDALALSVSVAADERNSQFVVAWLERPGRQLNYVIYVARFSATGELVRGPTRIGELVDFSYFQVAVQWDGSYLISWAELEGERSGGSPVVGVRARAYGADDKPLGDVVLVNDFVPGAQAFHQVVATDGGGYFVSWKSGEIFGGFHAGQDGSEDGIFARRLRADGSLDGLELQVNTQTDRRQGSLRKRVGVASSGRAVLVAWSDDALEPPGGGDGLGARWFRLAPTKSALCGDAYDQDLHREASDALEILRRAVDGAPCPHCLCDADGSGDITTADAVLVLGRAVGKRPTLSCPVCPDGLISPAGASVLPPGF
jgi:hypothetical protein